MVRLELTHSENISTSFTWAAAYVIVEHDVAGCQSCIELVRFCAQMNTQRQMLQRQPPARCICKVADERHSEDHPGSLGGRGGNKAGRRMSCTGIPGGQSWQTPHQRRTHRHSHRGGNRSNHRGHSGRDHNGVTQGITEGFGGGGGGGWSHNRGPSGTRVFMHTSIMMRKL